MSQYHSDASGLKIHSLDWFHFCERGFEDHGSIEEKPKDMPSPTQMLAKDSGPKLWKNA